MIDTPKGIDRPIQEMQQLFVDNLWTDIDISKKSFNHRVFKNKDRNGNDIPQIYKGNREYRNVSFNDRVDVLSWFDVSDNTNSYNLGQVTQDVGVFFAVKLDKLYTSLAHRAIEESHLDVQKILLKRPKEFEITGITTGAAAYGDFSTENLKTFNMQPWHVFRFNCNVSFTLNC
jgi:hypothetical protein